MEGFEVWDVIKVPFPYTDRALRQHRPALVVARQVEDGSPELLWVLMVTSASHRRRSGDVEVHDLAAAGLPVASMVRCAKLATVEAAGAGRLGRLPLDGRRAVRDALAGLLDEALNGRGALLDDE